MIAIDPGPERSALVHFDDTTLDIACALWIENDAMKFAIADHMPADVVIEMVASYGMAVGASVFDTCVWIGRFAQLTDWPGCGGGSAFIKRGEVALELCGNRKAKRPELRQRILDIYGGDQAIGTKANPGPLYIFKLAGKGAMPHLFSALAVGLAQLQIDEPSRELAYAQQRERGKVAGSAAQR